MKLRQIILSLLCAGMSCGFFDTSAMIGMSSEQEMQIREIEHSVDERLKSLRLMAWGELDQIKSTVAIAMVLELAYSIAQKNEAVSARWWYGIKTWEAFAAFSSLYCLGRVYRGIQDIAEVLARYQEFCNQVLGMQHGQTFLEDVPDLESDFVS